MKYVLIARILGSLIVSEHDNEELCLGRKELMKKEKSVTALECYKESSSSVTLSTGTITGCYYNNGQYNCK
jgi:hypothetical protein